MYSIKIYKDKNGCVQRDAISERLEFYELSLLRTWIKNNCDLKHNVLSESEFINLELEYLKEFNKTELKKSNSTVIISFAPKDSIIHQFQIKEWYIVNGTKQFVWSFINKDGQDYAKCNDGALHKIKTLKKWK